MLTTHAPTHPSTHPPTHLRPTSHPSTCTKAPPTERHTHTHTHTQTFTHTHTNMQTKAQKDRDQRERGRALLQPSDGGAHAQLGHMRRLADHKKKSKKNDLLNGTYIKFKRWTCIVNTCRVIASQTCPRGFVIRQQWKMSLPALPSPYDWECSYVLVLASILCPKTGLRRRMCPCVRTDRQAINAKCADLIVTCHGEAGKSRLCTVGGTYCVRVEDTHVIITFL